MVNPDILPPLTRDLMEGVSKLAVEVEFGVD